MQEDLGFWKNVVVFVLSLFLSCVIVFGLKAIWDKLDEKCELDVINVVEIAEEKRVFYLEKNIFEASRLNNWFSIIFHDIEKLGCEISYPIPFVFMPDTIFSPVELYENLNAIAKNLDGCSVGDEVFKPGEKIDAAKELNLLMKKMDGEL